MKHQGKAKQRVASSASNRVVRSRRQFTAEFKLEAVRLAAQGNRPHREVAQQLGIGPDMLYQWKRQAAARVDHPVADVFPGQGQLTSQDEEIRRLRRENSRLREERDILGKATAFFAKHAR
jgi:transposase